MRNPESETLTGDPTGSYTPVFDTGGFTAVNPDGKPTWEPDPVQPLAAVFEPTAPEDVAPQTGDVPIGAVPIGEGPSGPDPVSALPVAVPSSQQFVKRWKFVLVVSAVWLVAAAAGAALYYWWYTSLDKDPAVITLLMYLIVGTVVGLLLAMAQNKPLVSTLAIAIMSAPLAATAAAAVLHGAYFFEWIARPAIG